MVSMLSQFSQHAEDANHLQEDFSMDTISFFEHKLKSNQQAIETVEQNWDQKAETFYRNQVHGST